MPGQTWGQTDTDDNGDAQYEKRFGEYARLIQKNDSCHGRGAQ